MTSFKRTAIGSVAAVTFSLAALVAPASAAGSWHGGAGGFHSTSDGWRGGGRWHGGGWGAAGVGLAAGAVAGAALAAPYYYSDDSGYYDNGPGPSYPGYYNNGCAPGQSMYNC
jgi:hypothetical protein